MSDFNDEYLEDLVNFPFSSSLHHFPNGSRVKIILVVDTYYPMHADGKEWVYFYPPDDPHYFGHFKSPVLTRQNLGE